MDELSDFELIKIYVAGENRAFEILYGRYRTFLYSFICSLLSSNRSEVDDVFQNVWLRVIDKMPYLKEKGSFYGYLQQTARNMVIDRARSMKRRGIHVTIDDEESMPLPDTNTVEPYFEIFEIEDEKLLKQALASLNEDQRKVWELRMQNISFKDIAEMENCSLNTALARMNYAKKNIKLYIETHS